MEHTVCIGRSLDVSALFTQRLIVIQTYMAHAGSPGGRSSAATYSSKYDLNLLGSCAGVAIVYEQCLFDVCLDVRVMKSSPGMRST